MSKFSTRLRRAMEEQQVNQTELVAKTGISKASISQYLSGKNKPRAGAVILIAEALGVSSEWLSGEIEEQEGQDLSGILNLSVEQAARLMGVSPQFIRVGLQRNILPFGYAINMKGTRFTYYISPIKFREYTGIEV